MNPYSQCPGLTQPSRSFRLIRVSKLTPRLELTLLIQETPIPRLYDSTLAAARHLVHTTVQMERKAKGEVSRPGNACMKATRSPTKTMWSEEAG
jgi:hypothetical protein